MDENFPMASEPPNDDERKLASAADETTYSEDLDRIDTEERTESTEGLR
jgi:hypothetical protein